MTTDAFMPINNSNNPNTWEANTIADWLFNGMKNIDTIKNSLTNAFKPLVLNDDLDLERQLVRHFTKAGDRATLQLFQGLEQAITKCLITPDSYGPLRGLVYMLGETAHINNFKPLLRELIAGLLKDKPASDEALLILINVLAGLSPDKAALELLKEFEQANNDQAWWPSFTPLIFLAYVIENPGNWPSLLEKQRPGLKTLANDLDPKRFFSEFTHTLGVERIAKQLYQLDLNSQARPNKDNNASIEIGADKWFVDKLLGRSNSPLFALKDEQGDWVLTKRTIYPTGSRSRITLDENGNLERMLKSFNDEQRCEFLANKLVSSFAEEDIAGEEFEHALNEFGFTFSKADVLHFVSLASDKQQIDEEIRNAIRQHLDRLANNTELIDLTSSQQKILDISRALTEAKLFLTLENFQEVVSYTISKAQSVNYPEKIVEKDTQDLMAFGFISERMGSKVPFYYAASSLEIKILPKEASELNEVLSKDVIPRLKDVKQKKMEQSDKIFKDTNKGKEEGYKPYRNTDFLPLTPGFFNEPLAA